MPIIKTKSGGYKFGKSGKTYYGKRSKSKSEKARCCNKNKSKEKR